MAVKLDIELQWITNIQNIEKSFMAMNSRVQKMSKAFNKGYLLLGSEERTNANIKALEKYDHIFNKLFLSYEKINKTGGLSKLYRNLTGYKPTGKGGILSAQELTEYTSTKAWEEVERYLLKQKAMQYATTATSPSYKAYQRRLKEAKINEYQLSKLMSITIQQTDKAIARLSKRTTSDENKEYKLEQQRMDEQSKQDWELYKQQQKDLKDKKKKEEDLRKKELMLFLGKWGKFVVYGIAAQKIIHYLSKAFGLMSSTAQQGLSWQRTISGGASGGSWFGQDLAAYQRAGIDANKVQNFKRGLQGYIGSVKLGMGNAAPLMYLGLSALGDPDQLEQEMEKSLRRLPKDVSYALASQMGLDYDMWEAIYTGKIDKAREKPGYDKDAIEKWSEVAKKLNDLLTSIKTYGFNRFANLAYNVTHPGAALGQMTLAQGLSMIPGLLNPATLVPTLFKFADINVVIRNDKGDVIGTGTTQIEDAMKEISQSIGE